MDNSERLIPFLRELGHELENEYESINWGGCCVIAGMLGEHLQNFTEVKGGVVFNGWSGSVDLDEIRDVIANPNDATHWQRAGCTFDHVLVEIDIDGTLYLIDSEGVHVSSEYTSFNNRATGRFTLDETQGMAAEQSGWNGEFDRGQIPYIEDTINDAFERFARGEA